MPSTPPIESDLNLVIVNAVNARVESSVMAALSGDETIGRLVSAALQRPVEVPSPNGYGRERKPFMAHLVESAIRDATKAAVQKYLAEEHETLADEVRKHLRRAAPEIAAKMVGQLGDMAAKSYGIQVSLRTSD